MSKEGSRLQYSIFHESGSFYGIWLLVILVGVHTMFTLRSILEPLLWAFFIMMGLLPLTDKIESLLLKVCNLLCRPFRSNTSPGRRYRRSRIAESDDSSDSADGSSSDGQPGCSEASCGFARMTAVVLVLIIFTGAISTFAYIIYNSAVHMQEDWHHYEQGANRIKLLAQEMKKKVPDLILEKATSKALDFLNELLTFLLSTVLEIVSNVSFSLLMIFLYMMFWLCEPFHVGQAIPALFKQYIWLKGLASGLYAFCIWILLRIIGVDLAIVFALVTFMFNFIPEVGPFFAMMLPMPVLLFDGRLNQPFLKMLLALVGQLALKFIFGNIIEVKLVERQDDMRMHPVLILFFVAFFGHIWGATGMLLSVPIMATVKAFLPYMPAAYRDSMLMFLEGDAKAPERWKLVHKDQEFRPSSCTNIGDENDMASVSISDNKERLVES